MRRLGQQQAVAAVRRSVSQVFATPRGAVRRSGEQGEADFRTLVDRPKRRGAVHQARDAALLQSRQPWHRQVVGDDRADGLSLLVVVAVLAVAERGVEHGVRRRCSRAVRCSLFAGRSVRRGRSSCPERATEWPAARRRSRAAGTGSPSPSGRGLVGKGIVTPATLRAAKIRLHWPGATPVRQSQRILLDQRDRADAGGRPEKGRARARFRRS